MTTATSATTELLQTTLVELIDLSLQAKQAHWNVRGRQVRALHLQLDEVTDEYRLWSDDVAERLVTLGIVPDGRASAVEGSTLDTFPMGWVDDAQVIDLFVNRLDQVGASLKERIQALESDPVSQDMLIGILGGIEKQRWMIQAQGK